ncbi:MULTISPECIES: ABC transporter permease [unclassified Beijerinckia]|uniref:ABC transporter permease n=1 Tax=unclassified Beijerinckia TaxID=2638183 RepID=UPI00089BFEF3|nr:MULTISPECIES: ABC transporter permease [unclassified Beijerinckia]MDH7794740.1 putrescine transport system permease protein [Beijerinckia sp. GAS462]SEB73404.1 putrescine transport system permease protein [Beijerinckia sp. 28-YEA-48]
MTGTLRKRDVAILLAGFGFLYVPIALVIIYSFNASKLVTVWGGWSTRWYGSLLDNAQVLDSAWLSLKVAFLSGVLSTILGTMAALVLSRYGRFRGRLVFSSLIYAPLVMPEVIMGLSLLLLFVAIDMDRGFWTLLIAHTTFGLCFVAIVVNAKLAGFDRSLEEAARDLGASPVATFFQVTLPIIAPSVIAGFLLAFTISLDDFVIASFTTGPGATTLPMRIYSQVRLGVTPEINAISTLMIGTVLALVLFGFALTRAFGGRQASGRA